MNKSQSEKWMTHGEAGLAVFFSASAFLCMIAAAKALDTAFAFHASLGVAASLAAVFAIFNRYFDRPVALPPQEIDGRPNYNFGAGQVRRGNIGILGHCGLHWRHLVRHLKIYRREQIASEPRGNKRARNGRLQNFSQNS
jgi:hypothetical protein